MAALEQGFTSFIAPEKFPVCVLFLNIDANKVDVNVHPAKTEVRFVSEKEVFDLVYYGVKTALNQRDISAVLEESKKVNKTFWNDITDEKEKEHFENVVIQTTLVSKPKAEPL